MAYYVLSHYGLFHPRRLGERGKTLRLMKPGKIRSTHRIAVFSCWTSFLSTYCDTSRSSILPLQPALVLSSCVVQEGSTGWPNLFILIFLFHLSKDRKTDAERWTTFSRVGEIGTWTAVTRCFFCYPVHTTIPHKSSALTTRQSGAPMKSNNS